MALVLSICLLFLFPIISPVLSGGVVYSPIMRVIFWAFVSTFLLLTWLGSVPAEPPFVSVSLYSTVIYFVLIVALLLRPRLFPSRVYGFVLSAWSSRRCLSDYDFNGIFS